MACYAVLMAGIAHYSQVSIPEFESGSSSGVFVLSPKYRSASMSEN